MLIVIYGKYYNIIFEWEVDKVWRWLGIISCDVLLDGLVGLDAISQSAPQPGWHGGPWRELEAIMRELECS